jgi:hypothetical protein
VLSATSVILLQPRRPGSRSVRCSSRRALQPEYSSVENYSISRRTVTPMQEHINTVRDLAEQLNAIGSPISDGDLGITLLCSLSDEYDPIIISLESRDPNDITFDLIAARLLAEELRQKESVSHEMSSTGKAESALFANKYGDGLKPKICTYCKRPGHSEMNCWDKNGKPPFSQNYSSQQSPHAHFAY